MLAWMLYLTAVSSLLSLMALAGEHSARMWRLPRRWLWIAAMVTSGVIAIESLVSPPKANGSSDTPGVMVTSLSGLGAGPLRGTMLSNVSSLQRLDRILRIGWLFLSAATLMAVVVSVRGVGKERAGWSEADVDGSPVLLSDRTGPAVLGFVRPTIVLPRWVLQSDVEERSLILAHEQEHLRAGDQRLVALALLGVILAPWNVAFWWQLRRLRHAIELDCDQRVLRRGGSVVRYGALLLDTSRRPSLGFGYASPFGEPAVHLERRIAAMVEKTPRFGSLRGVISGSIGALLLVAACQVDRPSSPADLLTVSPAASTPSSGMVVSQDAGGVVAGRVVYADNGEPIAGAAVAIVGTPKGMLTRENGTFRIEPVPVGSREIAVAVPAPGGTRQRLKQTWAVTVEPGRPAQVSILIPRDATVASRSSVRGATAQEPPPAQSPPADFTGLYGGAIAGRVLDHDGRPFANAVLTVAGTAVGARTATDGSFAIRGVHPGRQSVLVTHEAIAAALPPFVVELVEGATMNVDLRVPRR